MIVEYIIYKRIDYRFVWGIYSTKRNAIIYVPSKKKILGIGILNEFFEQYLQKHPCIVTLPETKQPDDSLFDRLKQFENDSIIEVYRIEANESCSVVINKTHKK